MRLNVCSVHSIFFSLAVSDGPQMINSWQFPERHINEKNLENLYLNEFYFANLSTALCTVIVMARQKTNKITFYIYLYAKVQFINQTAEQKDETIKFLLRAICIYIHFGTVLRNQRLIYS